MADEEHIAPVVSHGRGGQGNIAPDPTKYVDAEITRQGIEGDQGDGAYSAGRGGAGNINSPHIPPSTGPAHDSDTIPPAAVRPVPEGGFHVGRGGQGNVNTNVDTRNTHAQDNEQSKEPAKPEVGGKSDDTGTGQGQEPNPGAEKRRTSFVEGWVGALKEKVFGRK